MLSLLTKPSFRQSYRFGHKLNQETRKLGENVVTKRWSGHNAMNITPSNYGWYEIKDILHFYTLLTAIPISVITTIINIRANPELTEIPEGYEPRHWEYYKHPITRFMARYFFKPMELEHELFIDMHDKQSMDEIVSNIHKNANTMMRFYGDHRSMFFRPHHQAGQIRRMRDEYEILMPSAAKVTNEPLETAYDPAYNPVPTEGYLTREYPPK